MIMTMTDGWLFHCELCYVEGSLFRLYVGLETTFCIFGSSAQCGLEPYNQAI